jgi:Protein of unknown function (DUF3305)
MGTPGDTDQHEANEAQAIEVAVVIERAASPNAWQDWAFRLVEVLPHESAFGTERRCLHDNGKTSRWLHPAWRLELFADECKGYFLNLTSGRPAWFVFWMPDEADASQVNITGVSVSYIEADRRMTAEEVVENLPLEPELCEWLRVFTNAHFRPDTGKRLKAMSFMKPEERERFAAAAAAQSEAAQTKDQARHIGTQDRNAALREMFMSDPHFKQSDGLDVAIDEVVAENQSPLARQRKIQQARALGLLDDELIDQDDRPGIT